MTLVRRRISKKYTMDCRNYTNVQRNSER